MSKIIIPANYTPALNLYDTQRAIGTVKRLFADTLCATLNLYRVSAPLFLEASTGLNDDLNGVERKVTFDIKDSGTEAQVVQSLAKWKRQALKDYDFRVGKGLYCDMNAIRRDEERCDHYEDILGTYLVKLSARKMGDDESEEAAELLKAIGDFERISDHAVNLLAASEELRSKGLGFSAAAEKELKVLIGAVSEILNTAERTFSEKDLAAAAQVEPLKQVIVALKEQMRTRHILRMQQGHCSIEAGFVWSDLLTDLERTADHCSNIAGCVLDAANHGLNLHETLRAMRADDPDFRRAYGTYAEKYRLQAV